MFFHLKSFIHSILFFLVLRLILSEAVSGFLIDLLFNRPFLLVVFICLLASIISFGALSVGKKWKMLPIPILLTASSVGLVAFIDSSAQKFAFEILATLMYYFCLLGIYRLHMYAKDQTARAIISLSAISAIFFFYSSLYGAYLNFTISLWMILSVFFMATCAVGFQYFSLTGHDKKMVLIYSAAIGMAMTEIAWALSFWPFGYLTTGVVLLIFYYVLWDMVYVYFIGDLSKKRVLGNMVLFGSLVVLVLASSKWLPVV